jgi:hypothetical protein
MPSELGHRRRAGQAHGYVHEVLGCSGGLGRAVTQSVSQPGFGHKRPARRYSSELGCETRFLGLSWCGTAIMTAALLFGAGHLPTTAAILPLTPLVIARALLLNGMGVIVVGCLDRKRGLLAAILAHFSSGIVVTRRRTTADSLTLRRRERASAVSSSGGFNGPP